MILDSGIKSIKLRASLKTLPLTTSSSILLPMNSRSPHPIKDSWGLKRSGAPLPKGRGERKSLPFAKFGRVRDYKVVNDITQTVHDLLFKFHLYYPPKGEGQKEFLEMPFSSLAVVQTWCYNTQTLFAIQFAWRYPICASLYTLPCPNKNRQMKATTLLCL